MTTIFRPTIVKNKVLKNGKHTVRISVLHNGETRYIPTKYIIDSDKEIKDGRIIKRKDSDYINTQLRRIIYTYEERCDNIPYSNSLSCSQLLSLIKESSAGKKHMTFDEIADEFIQQIDDEREKTIKLYKIAIGKYIDFAGPNTSMEQITPIRINSFMTHLKKSRLSPTSINIYMTLFRVIINYAKKMKYVSFEVEPFVIAKMPTAKKRDTYITVEQMRRVRDIDLDRYNLNVVRDMFMLTYYLAGMNLVDILAYNFKKADEICYIRKKTRNTKDGDNKIVFTIPDEAKAIISKYIDKKGKIVFGKYSSYVSCYNVLARKMPKLAEVAGINHKFTLYSARKSFVQHGFDLGVPLSTLEYCIGQSMKEDRPIFNYVTIMKRHADNAIRLILDNLRGNL